MAAQREHPGGMICGYASVSTDEQTVGAQVEALTAAGAVKVFRETASGAKPDRAQLRKVLAALDAGDVLMVTRLARLTSSTRDLLSTFGVLGVGLREASGERAERRMNSGVIWACSMAPGRMS